MDTTSEKQNKGRYLENPVVYWLKVIGNVLKWILFPFVLGSIISTQLLKLIYVSLAHVSKYAKEPKHIHLIIFYSFLLAIFLCLGLIAINTYLQIVAIHVHIWLDSHLPLTPEWVDELIEWLFFHILLLGTLYVVTLTLIAKITLFIVFNERIEKEIIKYTYKTKELNALGIKTDMDDLTSEHRYKTIYKFISYDFFRKVLLHYELATVNKKIHDKNTVGYLVSKNDKIFYLYDYWIYHTVFIGSHNSGLTNHVLDFINSVVKNDAQLVLIDNNADALTLNSLSIVANNNEKEFNIIDFSLPAKANLIYNPFKNKTAEQIASALVCLVLQELDNNDKQLLRYTITSIMNLMIDNGVQMNFNTILKHMNVSYIKTTYKEKINQSLSLILLDKNSTRVIAILKKVISGFLVEFKNYFIAEDYNDDKTFNFIDVLQQQNAIYYFNIFNKLSSEDYASSLQRLILNDLSSSSHINENERLSKKQPHVITYVKLTKSLFLERYEIPALLNLLSVKNIGVVFEISDSINFTNNEIIPELLLVCKSLFVHRILNNEILATFKNNVLSKLLPVNTNYEEYDIFYKRFKHYDDDDSNTAFADKARDKIIDQLYRLQTSLSFFSTVHYDFHAKNINIFEAKNIIYNTPFAIPHFSSVLIGNEKK